MKRKINFDRDGLTLVGDLFTPENFDENGHYKAVIVESSFTSVKEQCREPTPRSSRTERVAVR